MKVTAIHFGARNRDRAEVRLEDGVTLSIAREVLLRSDLRVGAEISELGLARLQREELAWTARESALKLLSVRARSASELSQRLRRKAFPPEIVNACVAELLESGLVDDEAFAASMVRDRVRHRPQGRKRLAHELRARGIDMATARDAIDEVLALEEVDDLELATRAAQKWRARPGENRERARRRLHDYLARRGFGAATVRRVMESLDL